MSGNEICEIIACVLLAIGIGFQGHFLGKRIGRINEKHHLQEDIAWLTGWLVVKKFDLKQNPDAPDAELLQGEISAIEGARGRLQKRLSGDWETK